MTTSSFWNRMSSSCACFDRRHFPCRSRDRQRKKWSLCSCRDFSLVHHRRVLTSARFPEPLRCIPVPSHFVRNDAPGRIYPSLPTCVLPVPTLRDPNVLEAQAKSFQMFPKRPQYDVLPASWYCCYPNIDSEEISDGGCGQNRFHAHVSTLARLRVSSHLPVQNSSRPSRAHSACM